MSMFLLPNEIFKIRIENLCKRSLVQCASCRVNDLNLSTGLVFNWRTLSIGTSKAGPMAKAVLGCRNIPSQAQRLQS